MEACKYCMQVRQNTEMESHEEKLHKMIIENKKAEVREQMKAKAQQIDKARMEASKGSRGMAYASAAGATSCVLHWSAGPDTDGQAYAVTQAAQVRCIAQAVM